MSKRSFFFLTLFLSWANLSAQTSTYYVIGDFNNWSTSTAIEMTYDANTDVYTAQFSSLTGGLKIIPARDWDHGDYGAAPSASAISVGSTIQLYPVTSVNDNVNVSGTLTNVLLSFYMRSGSYYLRVSSEENEQNDDVQFYIIGDFNNWTLSTAVEMIYNQDSGAYYAQLDTLLYGGIKIITARDWNHGNYGAESAGSIISLGAPVQLTSSDYNINLLGSYTSATFKLVSSIVGLSLTLQSATVNTSPDAPEFQLAVIHEDVSVPVTFVNDAVYPWVYTDGRIQSSNKSHKKSTSEFSFSYTSDYQTHIRFSWINYYTSYHYLSCYVDGVYQAANTSSSTTQKQFVLPAGTHVVTFRDSVGDYSSSYNSTSGVNNICVREIRPLETVLLTENSLPLTFQNDAVYPWIITSKCVENGNTTIPSSTSSFSTSFTLNEPAILEFDCGAYSSYSYDSYEHLSVYVDGMEVKKWHIYDQSSWVHRSTLLPPGKHDVKWEYWIGTSCYDNSHSYVRNISLIPEMTEIELEYAGTLGVEVLYIYDVLTDVKSLKVKGNLNSTDWATIKQMTQLQGLDLSEASFTSVPDNAFQNRSSLNYIVLPEGVQMIGDYAFDNTSLWQVHIPSTVTSIGQYAFQKNPNIRTVTFAQNSQLQSLGSRCFNNSGLRTIALPNSVTTIGEASFADCEFLDTLIFSDNITDLPRYTCDFRYNSSSGHSSLTYLHLPENLKKIGYNCFYYADSLRTLNLPDGLQTIDNYAFYHCISLDTLRLPMKLSSLGDRVFEECKSLKYIELPASASVGYYQTFAECTAINTIVCPSATPPSINYDPFYNARTKSAIILKVPSVSVVSYKLDSYWYKFGTIVEGEDPDFWDIDGDLMLTNNRRMSGKPNMRITRNGRLTVGGAAPMPINHFELLCSGSTSGALLNTSPLMSADSASAKYYIVDANKWYFLSPLYDVSLLNTQHSEGAQFVFRQFNSSNRANLGSGSSWQNVTTGVLHQGQGYILQSNGTGWINMPSLNHSDTLLFRYEDVEVPLQSYPSENVANENWNFIGNPYPAYYDIWYMDFTSPITVWTGSTYKAYSLADDQYALRPMQAFFVQKPDNVDKITFRKEGRQTTTSISHSNTAGAPSRIAASQDVNRKVYNLTLTASNGLSDETRIVINNAASLDYELTCDASKFMTIDPDCPQLYSIDGNGNRLAINERPLANGIVSLGVQLPSAGEYTFDVVSVSGIILVDNILGVNHDLHNAPYSFSINESEDNLTRFSLMFTSSPISTNIDDICQQDDVTERSVYTLDGRFVTSLSETADVHNLHLPIGIYLVRSGNAYVKVIIH